MTAAHAYGPELTWADRLRILRRALPHKPGQREMAATLGVPHGTYGSWETGAVAPNQFVRRAVAQKIEEEFGSVANAAWMLGEYPATPEPIHLTLVGVDDDEPLPRKDSNLQPPDQRSLTGHRWFDDEIPNYRSRTGQIGRRTTPYTGNPYCANFHIRMRGLQDGIITDTAGMG